MIVKAKICERTDMVTIESYEDGASYAKGKRSVVPYAVCTREEYQNMTDAMILYWHHYGIDLRTVDIEYV